MGDWDWAIGIGRLGLGDWDWAILKSFTEKRVRDAAGDDSWQRHQMVPASTITLDFLEPPNSDLLVRGSAGKVEQFASLAG